MRKQRIIVILCLICSLLCGCAQPRLSERAIVKAIYLDQIDGVIEAALVVFTGASGTNLSDVQSKARVYTGSANSVDAAIAAAESKQNKKPFYAHNGLLILGSGAVQGNVLPLLQYFTDGELSRQNLSVFFTVATQEEIVKQEQYMTEIVQICERQMNQSAGTRTAQSIDALRENACGYLPILKLQDSETVPAQMDGLLLLQNGYAITVMQNLMMQLALLCTQQTNHLTLRFVVDDVDTVLLTQNLFLQKEIKNQQLFIKLCGRAERCTQNGRVLRDDAQKHALACANEQLEQAFLQLQDITFLQGNDIFRFAWWLRQQDNNAVEQLLAEEQFYQPQRIHFQSAVRAQ